MIMDINELIFRIGMKDVQIAIHEKSIEELSKSNAKLEEQIKLLTHKQAQNKEFQQVK